MDPGEYEVCTYCGKSIFPGVAECPYCHHYTNGQGPYALHRERRIPRVFVIGGWVALAAFLLSLVWALIPLLPGCAPPQRRMDKSLAPSPQPPDQAPALPVCLLTGFEPFGRFKENASWEMLKPLAGQSLAGYRVVTQRLPVVYDEVAAPLQAAIERHRPQIVICFGLGSDVVQVELTARNGYSPRKPLDNRRRGPPREQIQPDGPEEIPTQLPAAEILTALRKAGIGAADSGDAGGYLCNECFYRLMVLNGGAAAGIRMRGFVHVPPVGAPDLAGGAYTLEKLQAAVRIIVETTARHAVTDRPPRP
jgi:pyroglutamyl-peptidase